MNLLRTHRMFVAIAAVLVAVIYAVIVVSVDSEIASSIGVGYLAVIGTLSLAWDFANRGKKDGHDGKPHS